MQIFLRRPLGGKSGKFLFKTRQIFFNITGQVNGDKNPMALVHILYVIKKSATMKAMNEEIAHIFDEMARLQEIKSDSAFRINANKKVAAILRGLKENIKDVYQTPMKG